MEKKKAGKPEKKQEKKNEKQELLKKQILLIAAGILLALLSLFSQEKILLTDGNGTYLSRPGYGEGDREEELVVTDGKGEKNSFSVRVSERNYTEEEAVALFEEMMPEIFKVMLGENESCLAVKTDLSFPTSLSSYPGISLNWHVTSDGVIEPDGTVVNADLTEEKECLTELTLSAGDVEKSVEIRFTVLPAPERKTEVPWEERLDAFLKEKDQETKTEETFLLPGIFEGEEITFTEPENHDWLLFPALGLAAAFLLGLMPKEEEKKRKKRREDELLLDYSEIVSKLIVYIGAGLTIRNAWQKLAESYDAKRDGTRSVYEEVLMTVREMANGETESKALSGFAKRCGLKCYVRMVSLLEQNRRTGDTALLAALELEMNEAFEQRKNVAKRMGEEAGTKLMAPLMISLATVFVIVVMPAVMTMS